jgi:hypothetical protein
VRLPIDCEKLRANIGAKIERLPVGEPVSEPTEIRVRKRA